MRHLTSETVALHDDDLLDLYRWPDGRPWVRSNMVTTIDGAITGPDGRSRSISSDADRRLFLLLRRFADAILVGAGTVRQEGYRPAPLAHAEARAAARQRPAFVHAIVTRSGSLNVEDPIFTSAPERPIVITTAATAGAAGGRLRIAADVIICGEQEVDLSIAVAELAERGLPRILCEGGPHLLGSMLAADLIDDYLLSLTPLTVGGEDEHGQAIGRIVDGPSVADGRFRLEHAIEDSGSLFLRYLRQR